LRSLVKAMRPFAPETTAPAGAAGSNRSPARVSAVRVAEASVRVLMRRFLSDIGGLAGPGSVAHRMRSGKVRCEIGTSARPPSNGLDRPASNDGCLEPSPLRLHADARAGRYGYRAVGLEYERLGQVLGEVPVARARIARHRDPGQGGEREIRRPADAGLEHAPDPARGPLALRGVVDTARLEDAPDPTGLDVDDAAGAEPDRCLGVARRTDGLVEADRRAEPRLERGVLDEVLVVQGLLDHDEPELVERLEERRIGELVGRVRVDREGRVRQLASHLANDLQVATGLDLQLDPTVPLRKVAVDLLQHGVD